MRESKRRKMKEEREIETNERKKEK